MCSLFTYTERKCIVMGDKNPKKAPKPKKNAKQAHANHLPDPEPEVVKKEKKTY